MLKEESITMLCTLNKCSGYIMEIFLENVRFIGREIHKDALAIIQTKDSGNLN